MPLQRFDAARVSLFRGDPVKALLRRFESLNQRTIEPTRIDPHRSKPSHPARMLLERLWLRSLLGGADDRRPVRNDTPVTVSDPISPGIPTRSKQYGGPGPPTVMGVPGVCCKVLVW